MAMAIMTAFMLTEMFREQPEGEEYDVLCQDAYFKPIVNAILAIQRETGNQMWRFRDIYSRVCLNLGATEAQAATGVAPCPYTGYVKNMKGLIRSWVEERSPDSRQYYFKQNRRKYWRPDERLLLFVNPGLRQSNTNVHWMPYNHTRGKGWILNPSAANAVIKPSENILNNAVAAYRPRYGMRGAGNQVKNVPCVVVSTSLRI